MKPAVIARWVFAATMIFLGILGITGQVTPIWTGVPAAVPARWVAYFSAVVSLAGGIGLLWPRTATAAAGLLLAAFLAWLVVFRLPHILEPPVGWGCGEEAVMVAGAWVLYARFGVRIARVLYGLALIPFGVAHFTFLPQTVILIPHWLPAHTAWAYFTGSAFIAAGVAVVAGVYARLAATLSTWQMALFTIIVWVPRVVTGNYTAFQWGESVDSVALTVAAWVVAESYRGAPWLGVRRTA